MISKGLREWQSGLGCLLRVRPLIWFAAIVTSFSSLSVLSHSASESLIAGFLNPPDNAKPRIWWHWMSGTVSKDGAELDPAWMKRVGIGGVHVFSGSLLEPSVVTPPVFFMSSAWKNTFRDSLSIAHDQGMEVTIAFWLTWARQNNRKVAEIS